MNIFQNISIPNLRLRPFYKYKHLDDPSNDLIIKVTKWSGSDPVFDMYEPFRSGYNIEFTVTSPDDLRLYVDNDYYFNVFSDENNIQIGDIEGFKITNIIPPGTPLNCLYTYTFKTVKPNKEAFKFIKL